MEENLPAKGVLALANYLQVQGVINHLLEDTGSNSLLDS
jgi:hypothetical protein